jgi:PAS domain S-box-containing protein
MIRTADILRAGILIVDDQPGNVVLLEQMLHEAGYVSVASTTDPTKVCELHRKYRYDLILLDLQMPGMDGFQVMEGLKEIELGGYLPVLVITAQPAQKLRALKAGAKDFVSKPFDLQEVLLRVHNLLEVRLLHQRENSLNSSRLENSQRMARLGDWEYDFASGHAAWSEEVYRILGIAQGASSPSLATYLARVHPDDLAFVRTQADPAQEASHHRNFEHRILRQDGQERHVRHVAEVSCDSRGRPAWESGTLQDITDQKLSEFVLSRNAERYRQMLMLSPAAHLLHVDGIITFVNTAFCRLTGADGPAQWLGRSVLDATHPESHRSMGKAKGREARGRDAPRSKIKFMRVDGTTVDADVLHAELELPGRREIQLTASFAQGAPLPAETPKRREHSALPTA